MAQPPDLSSKSESKSDPRVEQLVGQPLPTFPPTLIPPLLLCPAPSSANPAPLGSFLQQATPHCSSSASEATRTLSVPKQEQLKGEGEGLPVYDQTVMSHIRPTVEKPTPVNVTAKDQNPSASVAAENHDGDESDASVEVVEAPKQTVINIDDSDGEELIVLEPPQESISGESSTAGPRQNEER